MKRLTTALFSSDMRYPLVRCHATVPPYWPAVSLIREAEPWAPLLDDDRVVHEGFSESREARLTLVPDELSAPVKAALRTAGIDALYEHQSDALFAAFEG